VTVQRIPNQPGELDVLPPASEQVVDTPGGSIVVAVPTFADGDAYSLTITAA
jgi:hypothetical protein